jgi:hypothetical protein
MTDLDVLHTWLRLLQRHVQAANAIARIAEDPLEAPFLKALPSELTDIDGQRTNLSTDCRALVGAYEPNSRVEQRFPSRWKASAHDARPRKTANAWTEPKQAAGMRLTLQLVFGQLLASTRHDDVFKPWANERAHCRLTNRQVDLRY